MVRDAIFEGSTERERVLAKRALGKIARQAQAGAMQCTAAEVCAMAQVLERVSGRVEFDPSVTIVSVSGDAERYGVPVLGEVS